ncbi:hypothetical protein BCR39DRAFT_378994 [Naematelia encephala]|uniref:BZIP domain-containing protein n=1 Tax=Naematelia encephala TaxID=71784 RepID=A0A1Y2BDH3_9TREE|nr:hypothetical protein BCR39DRAFT_378994 [Naematelia encephala]
MQVGSSPKFSRSRLLSDSDIGESLETSTAAEIRSRRPRSHSWTSPVIVARRKSHALLGYSREDGLRELEMLEEEHGGSLNRPDKRRLQNRIAQRAFRARSKVHHADVSDPFFSLHAYPLI